MKVIVKFAGPLRSAAGTKEAVIDIDSGAKTGAVLKLVADQFPGIKSELFGEDAKTYYSIFVNDQLVAEKDRDATPVRDGDEILFLLPIAGGW